MGRQTDHKLMVEVSKSILSFEIHNLNRSVNETYGIPWFGNHTIVQGYGIKIDNLCPALGPEIKTRQKLPESLYPALKYQPTCI